ncbi:hypothetical protein GLYMA_08G011000v4 [Glycine max]|nr:hypothetical protein GLYMA_08G011000v4 [Glycine max]KAH1049028.1 hypothetical protein GYH30_019882 [Glycine max]
MGPFHPFMYDLSECLFLLLLCSCLTTIKHDLRRMETEKFNHQRQTDMKDGEKERKWITAIQIEVKWRWSSIISKTTEITSCLARSFLR